MIKLLQVIQIVTALWHYQPGANPNNYQPWKFWTWCNQAVFTIFERMNYDINPLCNQKGRYYTDANDIYFNARAAWYAGKITLVSKQEAIKAAWQGTPVLVTTYNFAGKIGHCAIIAPVPYHGDYVGQAGAKNGIMKLSEGFNSRFLSEPRFYLLRKATK